MTPGDAPALEHARRDGAGGWWRRIALVALVLAALPLVARQVYLVPDSSGYVSYARSLVWDRDVDLANDYARFGMIDRQGTIAFGARTATGRPGNPFGIGSALLWSPFVAAAAVAARVGAAFGVPVATDGFGTATLVAVELATWTCGLAALLLVAATLRALFPGARALDRRVALAAASLGTPFIYYMVQMPTYSHVPSAFATALAVYLGVRWREAWTPARALALGVVVGFAGTVRVQDGAALVLLPPLLARWGGAFRTRVAATRVPLYVAGLAFGATPQLATWRSIYGSALPLPQGEGFLHTDPRALLQVLLSTHHGLLPWSPVVALALVGGVLLAVEPRTRGLAAALLLTAVVEWVASALPVDWWAGWSFGGRRFTSCLSLVAVGAMAAARRGRALRNAVVLATALAVVQWLRVASRDLGGDADPGWWGLWGGGFWRFLPRIPAAILRLVSVPWARVHVLRPSAAPAPQWAGDPAGFTVALVSLWIVGILALAGWWGWRTRGRSGT